MQIADRDLEPGRVENQGGTLEEIGPSLTSINFVAEIRRERAHHWYHRSTAKDSNIKDLKPRCRTTTTRFRI